MVKVETSMLVGRLAADSGTRGAERRAGAAGHRPAGVVGDGTIRTVIRAVERGAP